MPEPITPPTTIAMVVLKEMVRLNPVMNKIFLVFKDIFYLLAGKSNYVELWLLRRLVLKNSYEQKSFEP